MSENQGEATAWRFIRFGLVVTGHTEEQVLPRMFKSLCESGHGNFKVLRRVGQRNPITSKKRAMRMVGSGKMLPDRDTEEIGLPARTFLRESDTHFLMLVDDLERDRTKSRSDVFDRYRRCLDTLLGDLSWRAGVFFLVNMLEAYYFADTAAIVAAIGQPGKSLTDRAGDVELIPHPKNELRVLFPSFNEIRDGKQIIARLDMAKVLSRPDTCASIRTLFAWCALAMQEESEQKFSLDNGIYCIITGPQLKSLANSVNREKPVQSI